MDIHEQLQALRKRVARIDAKYAKGVPKPAHAPPPPRTSPAANRFVEEFLTGEEIENELGRHFQTQKLYERHRRYGSVDLSDLAELPDDLLETISEGESGAAPPARWAFLDTETTGLAGGSGTYAFLVGVGSVTREGFGVKQFLMRDYDEEASMLLALDEHLRNFDILVTYNGKAYDQPLLETRFRMSRRKPPFSSLRHVDLLHSARRLWKLRFDSCRLVDLENRILGVEREGDLPGELIPYVYFEYVRTREAFRLAPILHHNVCDLVALACLTAIVPFAFKDPDPYRFGHGAEMLGLARWLRQAGQEVRAAAMFRAAISAGLRDDLLYRAMWDLAAMEKKLGREEAALTMFTELAGAPNPFRVEAYEELAKHFEHRERNYTMALEMTHAALSVADTPELRKRQVRLSRRAASRRLL